jgi:hypothetical protein
VAEAVTRRHQKVRQILVESAGGKCAVCGYDRCIISLHFHHVDPATKSFNMTMATGKSEAAYLAEAQKCVLVCANCHGEIEAGIIESPPAPGMSRHSSSAGLNAEVVRSRPSDSPQLRMDLGEHAEALPALAPDAKAEPLPAYHETRDGRPQEAHRVREEAVVRQDA